MRTLLLAAAMLSCLAVRPASCQNSEPPASLSGFTLTAGDFDDPRTLPNLETLCRVWGYAKYHHPAFYDTLRRVDIDSALFSLLPRVVHADREIRNRHLLDWVRSLGDYAPNRVEYEQSLAPLELVSTVDLAWTRDTTLLGRDLSRLLQDLRYAERGENYYLRMGTTGNGPGYHYLSLRGESFHPTPQMDSGLNLLTLFRLWNIIEYYAPYRAVTLHPWEEVLSTYIPLMGVETDGRRFARLYMRLIRELNDGHAYAPIEMLFGQRMLPVWPLQADGRLFVGYSGDSALERGDEVVAIDGEPLSERLELLREYASRSNEASLRRAARYYGLCTRRDTAEVVLRRAGACDTLHVATVPYGNASPLYDPAQLTQPPFRLLADSVGYIYAGTFSREHLAEVGQTLPRTRALIIDLRTYPLNVADALIALIGQSLRTEPVVCLADGASDAGPARPLLPAGAVDLRRLREGSQAVCRALQRAGDLTRERADAEQPRVPGHGAAAMPADADHRFADLGCRRGYRPYPVTRRVDDLFFGNRRLLSGRNPDPGRRRAPRCRGE